MADIKKAVEEDLEKIRSEKDKKVQESIIVRGVCSSVQNMALPTIDNIISLFKTSGIEIKRVEPRY